MHTAIYIIVFGKLGTYPSMIIFMSRLMQNITFTPLNRPRQLRGHVIDHPVHPLHLVDDPRRHAAEDVLGDFQFGTKSGHHLFCMHCGVRPLGRGYIEQIGGDYISVQVSTPDDVTPAELIAAPVRYANGRDNSWWTEPAETRHL